MSDTTEQRQHPRYAIEMDAEVVGEGVRAVGRTRDISRGGFCMLTPQPIEVGIPCEVKLALVFAENSFSEQLSLPATVMWCTAMRGQHQVGVKFTALDQAHKGYLDLFIRFLEEGDEEDDDHEDLQELGDEPLTEE